MRHYKRIQCWATENTQNHNKITVRNLTAIQEDQNLIRVFIYSYIYIYLRTITNIFFIFYVLCFNIIKIVIVYKENLRLYLFILWKIFKLTWLTMAQLQAETCSTHVKAQFESKYTCVVFKWISVVYLVINTTEWFQ